MRLTSRVCSSRGEMVGDGAGMVDQRVRVGVGRSTSVVVDRWTGGREGFEVIGVRGSFS